LFENAYRDESDLKGSENNFQRSKDSALYQTTRRLVKDFLAAEASLPAA